jgi:hypothetical protein
MRSTLRSTLVIVLLGGAIWISIAPQRVQAQQPSQLTSQQFQSNSAQILAKFPNGGGEMIALIRELTLADQANLPVIINLLPNANDAQGSAIGTGLGQAALASVKTNQSYAATIQQVVLEKGGGWAAGDGSNIGGGSAQPKIGTTITTKDQVDGVTEKGTLPITTGTHVFANELVRTGLTGMAQVLLADHTNLSIAPVTEIRLDKFVYDPNGKPGNVIVEAGVGAFRFITGLQQHEAYEIKTPYATMGVRGTEFIVVITQNEVQTQLLKGEVVVTTISGKVVTMSTPSTVLSVDSHGNTQGPTPSTQSLANFADLGPPVTNVSFADALDAYTAVTGGTGLGATTNGGGDGGGGGGVGSVTALTGGSSLSAATNGGGGGSGGVGSVTPLNFSGTPGIASSVSQSH